MTLLYKWEKICEIRKKRRLLMGKDAAMSNVAGRSSGPIREQLHIRGLEILSPATDRRSPNVLQKEMKTHITTAKIPQFRIYP